jgi:hypothetical protein
METLIPALAKEFARTTVIGGCQTSGHQLIAGVHGATANVGLVPLKYVLVKLNFGQED